MVTVCLYNEANLPAADFKNLILGTQEFANLVTKAWNLPNVVVTDKPATGDWEIHLSEANRHTGASGYHTFINNVPVAWCSPKAAVQTFGTYYPPRKLKLSTTAPIYSIGLITTICHELAEMLCDPAIKTLSSYDKQNRKWLVEVCDHVFGVYFPLTVNGINMVVPDVTTPAFYSLTAKGPYDLQGVVKAPFTLTPKGYGYWEDASGHLFPL